MKCRGLLADVNVQGHLPYFRALLERLALAPVLDELGFRWVTFRDLGLALDLDDRALWTYCQTEGWALLTENRNHDGALSLHAALLDLWRIGHLPVLTLANKNRCERDPDYARHVAEEIAEILFGLAGGEYLDQPRIYLPLRALPD